jgi:hypothetical protein
MRKYKQYNQNKTKIINKLNKVIKNQKIIISNLFYKIIDGTYFYDTSIKKIKNHQTPHKKIIKYSKTFHLHI